MPSLLPGAPQSDLGSHFHPGIRKTHLVPGYVCLSDDYRSPLLGMRPRMPPCKAGRERGPRVSLLETRKSFHLRFCHSLSEQGKSISSSLVCQEPFLQAISIPHSQEATQYSVGGSLFQAGQQWQVDQRQAQEASRKQSVPLLRCRRLQAGLLSQRLRCFSNCFREILGKIESDPQDSAQTEGCIELPCAAMSPIQLSTSTLSDPHSLFVSLTSPLILGQDHLNKILF